MWQGKHTEMSGGCIKCIHTVCMWKTVKAIKAVQYLNTTIDLHYQNEVLTKMRALTIITLHVTAHE